MKTTKLRKRLIALLLCLAMLLCLMPASAIATDLVANETASLVGAEVVSLREENVKHFDMGDGTYQAIAYSHPVHEMDSEGNWQDMDFSMNLTQAKGVRAYTNSAGTALAANYIANQPLVTLSGEGTSIAMTLVSNANTATMSTQATASTATVAAEFTATQTQIQTFEDAQAASFSNTLLYENVMPGIDLEYIVDPWTVKENIIVNQPASKYEYRFKLDLNGLYPVLQEDGSILIYNSATDEAEYEIPAPYMYDATGEMSFDVSYAVTGSNGIYYLTVTADEDWINAGEREFPVAIDPSVTEYQNINMDTYINQDTPNEARGGYKFFFVGENEVAYIYTPTPTLPEFATFEDAELSLYYFYKDFVTTGYVDFSAHSVDFYWAEESLKWTDVVGFDYETYDNYRFGLSVISLDTARTSGTIGATSSSPKPVTVNIKIAVKDWLDDDSKNKGIGLRYVTSSPNKSVMFRSTEGVAQYRPKLVYSYSLPYDPENLREVNLTLQYDHAYTQRQNNPQYRIGQEAALLKTFFLEEYDILVDYGNADDFESYPEKNDCFSMDNLCMCEELSCTYADSDTNHHTNIHQILYDTVDTDSNSFIMSYIGWNTCEGENGACYSNTNKGLAFPDLGVMAITNYYLQDIGSETVTAIHEMGHMFGIKDHYDKEENNDKNLTTQQAINEFNDSSYDELCLYGEDGFDANSLGSVVICQGCRNRVEEWRNAHSD